MNRKHEPHLTQPTELKAALFGLMILDSRCIDVDVSKAHAKVERQT